MKNNRTSSIQQPHKTYTKLLQKNIPMLQVTAKDKQSNTDGNLKCHKVILSPLLNDTFLKQALSKS